MTSFTQEVVSEVPVNGLQERNYEFKDGKWFRYSK
jgi:hypothetical protein